MKEEVEYRRKQGPRERYNVNLTNIHNLKILNGGEFHGDPVVRSSASPAEVMDSLQLVNQDPARHCNKLMNFLKIKKT